MSTRLTPTDVTVGAHSFFCCGSTAGVTQVTYTATDGDGNVGTCTMTVEVVDIQDPTLSCPTNFQLDTCPGSSCQGLPYLLELIDSPVIEDNSDETLIATAVIVRAARIEDRSDFFTVFSPFFPVFSPFFPVFS